MCYSNAFRNCWHNIFSLKLLFVWNCVIIICYCALVTAVEQSFERMGFGVSHDGSGYTYMPQQMSTQPAVNLNEFTTSGSTAAYPTGSYVSSHHHQVAMQVFWICVDCCCFSRKCFVAYCYNGRILLPSSRHHLSYDDCLEDNHHHSKDECWFRIRFSFCMFVYI